MRILPQNLTTPFFLIAALSTFSYGINNLDAASEPKLAHDILAANNTFTIASAERASQEISGHFLGKNNTINTKISALEISTLESEYKNALLAIRLKAEVDENFNLVGAIPADAEAFLKQAQEGQKTQNLLEIAYLKKEILEREAAEALELFNFFGGSTTPLSILLELKKLIITKEMLDPPSPHPHMDYHYQGFNPAIDTPALAFIAGIERNVIFLDTKNLAKRFPSNANHAGISLLLKEITDDIERERGSINQWLEALPRIWEKTSQKLVQAEMQQSILNEKYPVTVLKSLNASNIAAYKSELRITSEIVQEKKGILNTIHTFKEFVDDTMEYLRANSKIT